MATPLTYLPDIRDNPHVRELMISDIKLTQASVDFISDVAHSDYVERKQKEMSYFNFISAENGWGISSWFTPTGEPPSVARMRGSYCLWREVSTLQIGLKIMKDDIEKGQIPSNNMFVRQVLNGPVSHLIEWNSLLRIDPRRAHHANRFVEGLLKMATNCQADDMVRYFGELYGDGFLGIQAPVEGLVPSALTQFRDGTLTDIANFVIPLHGVLAMTAGGLVGGAVSKLFAARGISFETPHWAFRLLVPGLHLFRFPTLQEMKTATGLLRYLGAAIWESAKLFALMTAAESIGNDDGRQVGFMVYLGVLAGVAGWKVNMLNRVGAELSGANDAIILRGAIASGVDKSRLGMTVGMAAMHVELRSFRLGRSLSTQEIVTRVQGIIDDIAKSARTQTMAQGQVTRMLNEAEKLVQKYPEKLGNGFWDRMRQMAENPDAVAAARDLRSALEGARQSVSVVGRRLRMSVKPTDTAKPSWLKRPRREETVSPKDVGTPWQRRDTPTAGSGSKPQAASVPPVSVVGQLITTPPDRLTMEIVRKVTDGRIQIERAAWDKMTDFYARNSNLRSALLRRLWEFATDGGNNWTALEHVEGCYRGRVGIHYRLLAERAGGHTRIYDLLPRQKLEGKVAWRPPKVWNPIE